MEKGEGFQKRSVKISGCKLDLRQTPASHLSASKAAHVVGVNRRGREGSGHSMPTPQVPTPLPLPNQALTLTTPTSRLKLMMKSMVISRKLETSSATRQTER